MIDKEDTRPPYHGGHVLPVMTECFDMDAWALAGSKTTKKCEIKEKKYI